jgi:hypothetical protein
VPPPLRPIQVIFTASAEAVIQSNLHPGKTDVPVIRPAQNDEAAFGHGTATLWLRLDGGETDV